MPGKGLCGKFKRRLDLATRHCSRARNTNDKRSLQNAEAQAPAKRCQVLCPTQFHILATSVFKASLTEDYLYAGGSAEALNRKNANWITNL